MSYMPNGPLPMKKMKPIKMPKTDSIFLKYAYRMYFFVNDQVSALNQSKYFAGLMIITINIASKFVNFNISRTMESYLRFTFSRDILIFAIMWMGTRDIFVAGFMTILFILIMDYLLNENSMFCCLPESFTTEHLTKLEENSTKISEDDIKNVEAVLEKAKEINKLLSSSDYHLDKNNI